ncbi:MAG: hypothetical protein EXS02_13015 [Planctomycetes bacterium]|nr:hypothetical protein [Planctomycetota bacterium]
MQLPAVSALLLAILASCASSKTTAEVGIGAGSYGVSFDGGDSGSTNAALFELALESVSASHFGGGARLRGTASGDDLFDGVEQIQASDGLFYIHATYDPGEGARRLPFRFGLASNVLGLESQITGESITFASTGPRLEFAPQFPLTRSNEFSLAATGLLGIGTGFTSIEVDSSELVNDWTTTATFYDLGFGLRADFKSAYLDLGFRYLASNYSESDVSGGLVIRALDADFTGLVLSFGAKF